MAGATQPLSSRAATTAPAAVSGVFICSLGFSVEGLAEKSIVSDGNQREISNAFINSKMLKKAGYRK
ncbi:hypothetical protein J4732_00195 [Serratia marcescens]|uniref:Uncharacterized protein n=1 Tax=Serratia marcescens TaxID=615 RepID=A0A939NPD8_SERMA|nr:hypothetical protein [Serratia marcescens]